ncbi:MAG: S-layer homology domain-containing protein [Clostridia bacterium]|nr:S-layer homology domain-containing protein [Clostridia bacterium]
MSKKIISIISAFAAVCMSVSALAISFSDVDPEQYSWCASQIDQMSEEGYINGYEDGTFRPDNEVTRLEGIALFARAMGSSEEINAQILSFAHAKYDSMIKACSVPWGSDELAYMLYKGAFQQSDLDTYVMGTAKNKPLTRGEAAVIMTKAMGGEDEAKSIAQVQLTYRDSRTIPTNILQYVQYVTDHGIMNGSDGKFNPNDNITRAQMTVMLARAVEACDYSFEHAKIMSVDEASNSVVLNVGGLENTYDCAANARFNVGGEAVTMSEMLLDTSVVVQFAGKTLVSADTVSNVADQTITAIYDGNATTGGIVKIRVKESASAVTTLTYECIKDVPVTYKGSPASLASLRSGDAVELVISDGKVQSISATEKIVTIPNAKVEELKISEDGDLYMTISTADAKYNGKTYKVAGDAKVKKSNTETDMSEVYEGDKVKLELRYGVVTSVEATSTRGSLNGTIVSILIAAQPEITVKADGKEKTYQIPQGCEIIVNQSAGSLYDFRVGDNVSVTTVSNAVTKIQTSTAAINTEGGVTGVVGAVNTSYGFLNVMTEASDVPFTVFKTSNKTTIITTTGKAIDFKSIKVGDTVQCTGTTTNGAFVATLIIVTQK